MSVVFRAYEPSELGEDGYPRAWHRSSTYRHYPSNEKFSFPAIKDAVRELAGHRCVRCRHPYRKGKHRLDEEGQSWSPCDEQCVHGGRLGIDVRFLPVPDGERPTQWEARARILTVHHLDEDKANCRWWNLAALCQRCHLRMQRAVVMDRPWHYEHSEWFKPYAAGFYAFKYLGEDLTREQTMERLDELLALEHRFTQEVLL
jgi:hypothetical protein